MQIWSKYIDKVFRQNADKVFFLPWVGYFGIEKVFTYMHINVPSIWSTYNLIWKFTVRYFNQQCLVRKVLTCLEIRKAC